MPEAKFILKEPNSKSETLVYLFFNFNYQRLKYSTGEKVHPKFWNAKKQRVKETSQFVQFPEFNQRLSNIESAVKVAYYKLLNNKDVVSPDILKQRLLEELGEGRPQVKLDFIQWMEKEIEGMKNDKKYGSIQVYRTLLRHLKEFSKSKGYVLNFDTINLDFYEQFKTYILVEKGLLTNTFGKQIKTLKTFLNLATEKGVNSNLAYKSRLFRATLEDVDHIYLTLEELDSLHQLDLTYKPYLDRVRDLFLIGCFTGLRFSDFTQLKGENLEKAGHGYVFNVKTQKTNERVVIPVKPILMSIWEKYDGTLPRAISNQKMNKYLKELGKAAGITNNTTLKRTSGKQVKEVIRPKNEFITTHTARRSFATNAYLEGVPAISIMKFTGHRTESSFMKYIKVSQERNALLLMNHDFFK